MASETRQVNGLTIHRYNVIGTDLWVYEAWEPSVRPDGSRSMYGHSTIRFEDGGVIGRVGTRCLPADLEALPSWSDERLAAVGRWHAAQYEEAYAAILSAYPEAAGGRKSMGDITVHRAGA